ncbi:MAG: HEAT repeat domain-containing protein [Acidobacteriia bacterium]|nr:HEAT repeat domain-containing protein [Terriglobia bacterium]
MRLCLAACLAVAAAALVAAQDVRPKDVREIAKAGSNAIPKLQEFLKNPDLQVRVEAVRQITEIGTQRSLDPLILATQDNDPEMQVRATDGLVNFYLPGYVKTGFGASLSRVGSGIKGKFTETNDQVIDPYIMVRPDVISALGRLARSGGSLEVRANAARAIGILRGRAAIPDLLEAIRSKDTDLIYESLIAIQKIRDEPAAVSTGFLVRDLNPKVQVAAIETVGLLRNKQALPDLIDALNRTRDAKVRRASLTSIAMLPAESSRAVYARYLQDKDDKMRAAAAEGYARLRNPDDLPMLQKAWQDEGKTPVRLALAFAQVELGEIELSEFSPLRYLINTLNSAAFHDVAFAYLVEAARDDQIRTALYPSLDTGTKDEKIGIARVLARSGDRASIPKLQKLGNDTDTEVAQEGVRALRNLQARF